MKPAMFREKTIEAKPYPVDNLPHRKRLLQYLGGQPGGVNSGLHKIKASISVEVEC